MTRPNIDTDRTLQRFVPSDGIRCYECNHEYHYLGDEPHPGVCPECGSVAVSPAGELSVYEIESVSHRTDTETDRFYRIRCLDESSQSNNRRFDIHAEREGETFVITDVTAETVTLPAADVVSTSLLPLQMVQDELGSIVDGPTVEVGGGA